MKDDDLTRARAENAALADQLRRARADLHRLGARDMYRMMWLSVASGAGGLVVGTLLGMQLNRRHASAGSNGAS